MSALRLAFIGGSVESAVGKTHYIATKMDREFSLRAACFSTNEDINAISAKAFSDDAQTLRLYYNYKDLLQSEKGNIDAICVLTPTPIHKEMVIESLLQGYAVICEKTLALSLSEALEIMAILKQTNGFLAVIYNYTGYPMLRELKSRIKANHLGRIHSIHIEMPQEGFIKCDDYGNAIKPQDWRLKDSYIPIVSLDLGIHCQNIISFLTDSIPLECIALSASYGNFANVIDDVNILARYQSTIYSDIHVNMWFSKSALGFRNGLQVRIQAENYSAIWLQTNPEILLLSDKRGQKYIVDRASPNCLEANKHRYNRFKAGHPAGFIEAFANYYSDIASELRAYIQSKTGDRSLNVDSSNKDFIRDFDSPYIFGIYESLLGLAFFEGAQKSLSTRSIEQIPPISLLCT
ncbi:Gfo/Idh/MocA family protein [Helicobacter muridarum]|uniref:Glucose--fructose oxidoreductase n=1 Tax=Helicobacter muridarum TaxID=216 RepID=A0A377PSI8_9HELI|nr:Gfo/Idh/MocA family oxidoreductase [Helicobacter muridarum]STQ85567.1 Glucose--fructose oxidoreductase precursor [Helicobacter muridarum]